METKRKTAIVFATYTLADPITRNTIHSISSLFDTVISVDQNSEIKYKPLEANNVKIVSIADFKNLPRLNGIKNIIKWILYKVKVRRLISRYKPDLLMTFMLKPLAAIKPCQGQKIISCIYDIPDPRTSGKLDSLINKIAFKKLKNADLIWASDEHKALLTSKFAGLKQIPEVCYNCPSKNVVFEDKFSARKWLREKLRTSGALIGEQKGTVLIRAGAIGPYGGIEETLDAMKELADDDLFLMMGRPGSEYASYLVSLVREMGLERRAFFWDKPDDETWQKALSGADIGHMVHLPPPNDSIAGGLYKYNSSLSNNRLFLYMAAGIPILSYNDERLDHLHNEIDCFCVLNITHLNEEILKAWKMLSINSLLREKMGNNAKQAFIETYNWEYQFEKVLTKI